MTAPLAPSDRRTWLISVRATSLAVMSRARSVARAASRSPLPVSSSAAGSSAVSRTNVTQVSGSSLSTAPATSTVRRVPSRRTYSFRCGP